MKLKKFGTSVLALLLCVTMLPISALANPVDDLSEDIITINTDANVSEDEVVISEEVISGDDRVEGNEIVFKEDNSEDDVDAQTIDLLADEAGLELKVEECTLEEHIHDAEECYVRELICEGHSEEEHTSACFENVFICGYEEHIHNAEACFGEEAAADVMLFDAGSTNKIKYDYSYGGSTYYNVISQKDWDIAPGIAETEIVLNNADGTRRQVLHTATVDLNNPYTKVIPGYKGMWPSAGNYGTQSTSTQALAAEKLGYGNVVVATNTTLSWYTDSYYKANPNMIGEPLGYSILNGEYYTNSQGHGKGAATCIVINYDKHPIDGTDRPEDMPKVWIRNASDPLTGWEEQAIPVSFTFLVKPDVNGNPVNQYSKNGSEDHGSGIASRTFVGVRADGTLVIAVSDGEQAPFSTGFTSYEMADYMIKMGCVIAANCDGGGSTTFCSQRPGEDLKVNCSLADGGERPTTSTILVISTAPADGTFARATISSEFEYYAPGSTVNFSTLGTDAVGNKVDIPADVQWQVAEDGMGTIENGVFVSSGKEGTATIQMVYNGQVAGEREITIAAPEEIFFEQPVVTVPFGKTAEIPVKATINNRLIEIGIGASDVSFVIDNEALGTFDGMNFVAVAEAAAPDVLTGKVTATLKVNPDLKAEVQLCLGRGSAVLWGFENGQADIDVWNVINNRKNAAHWDYELALSLADRTNGQVHDGNYSMRLETNGLSSKDSHAEQYAWIRLGLDGEATVLKNARSVGFWLYVPEDNVQCMVQGHYMTDSNGDGVFDTEAIVSMMEQEDVYYNIDESGWHYLSMDISAFQEVALKAATQYDKDPSDGMTGEKGEFFLALIFHKATNNLLWSENGSINGPYTYYLDSFTVDYSEAVDDRENPVFDKIYLDGTTALVKRDVITTTSNILNLSAAVADQTVKLDANKNEVALHNVSGLDPDTAKVYIDGVEVESSLANGKLSANDIAVADGYHRVKFEICDKAGNKSVVIRVVKVESGVEASTIHLVPDDATLDRIPFGSIYWMNLKATDIETIQSVNAVIDLNNVNHWQLDHMELAPGFTAEYTIAEETNTATITITRVEDTAATGEAVLAKLPVRIVYFDTDIKTPGYTAETYWTTYPFWPQDMKMDVDKGVITYVDSYSSSVQNTFSNEEFHVDTEMFTDKPHMAQVDFEYLNEHGTTHVHAPVALKDQAASCTAAGYTNRTFCEGCNSVVDWGTTISADDHTYKVVNGHLTCDCGKVLTATGLQIIDGKGYYLVNGKLTTGWLTVEDEWYYFDPGTGASVEKLNNGYVTFEFEIDGKVKSGQWYHTSAGSRYYYGMGYYQGNINGYKWVEIDGKNYCFNHNGYCLKGIDYHVDDYADLYEWYDFGDDGASRGKLDYTGIMHHKGNIYYLVDGCSRAGMFYADGAYYHANFEKHYAAIKNVERNCYYKNNYGLLPVGTYLFGYDGKMVDKNVYNKNGTLYYYVLGKTSQGTGVFTLDGVEYPIESNGKVLFTGVVSDASGERQYYENGVQAGDHNWNEGVVATAPTCTATGVKTYTCSECGKTQTVTIAALDHLDENKDYLCDRCNEPIAHEHVWDDGKVTTPATCKEAGVKTFTCECGETKTEPVVVRDHIDENGDCSCDRCGDALAAKNGLVFDSDGNIRYYVNGAPSRAGLVQDSDGNFYYINSSLKAVKNCAYAFSTAMGNGLLPGGTYQFDATGKLIDPPGVHVHSWGIGEITTPASCTADGVKTYTCACGETKTETVAKLDHIDEDSNFTCDRCGTPVEHVHIWGDGEITTPASCTADGVKTYTCACSETKTEPVEKLGHIDEDGNFACDRCNESIDHEHIWDEGKITTVATCKAEGVKTYTCACSETKTEPVAKLSHIDENGDCSCDRCGDTLGAKNGLVFDSDGHVRYYVNGVPTRAGLVQDSEGNYYYINSTLKAVKNCTYAFSTAMGNGLLPGGTYQFDATGKLILK